MYHQCKRQKKGIIVNNDIVNNDRIQCVMLTH